MFLKCHVILSCNLAAMGFCQSGKQILLQENHINSGESASGAQIINPCPMTRPLEVTGKPLATPTLWKYSSPEILPKSQLGFQIKI